MNKNNKGIYLGFPTVQKLCRSDVNLHTHYVVQEKFVETPPEIDLNVRAKCENIQKHADFPLMNVFY